jgi:hypothetical protein
MVACWLEPYATLQWRAGQTQVPACNLDDAFTLTSRTLGNVKAAVHALPSVTGAITGAEHQPWPARAADGSLCTTHMARVEELFRF